VFVSKNFEILLKANRTADLFDDRSRKSGGEGVSVSIVNRDPAAHARRAEPSENIVEAAETASTNGSHGISRPTGAESQILSVRARSWGHALAELLGNTALEGCTTLGICPAGTRAGAAAVAATLGEWMMQYVDPPVLLIDANLRHPNLAQVLGAASGPGLAEAFLGSEVSDFDVVHDSTIPGLSVLPAGSPINRKRRPEVGRLFGDHYHKLHERYQNIVIHLPSPSDPDFASFPFAVADAVLLAVQPNRTSVRELQRAVRQLAAARARLVGTVIDEPGPAGLSLNGNGHGGLRLA
jgi:hypothetical protein